MRDVITILPKETVMIGGRPAPGYKPAASVRGYFKPAAGNKLEAAAATGAVRPAAVIMRREPEVVKHLKESSRLYINGDDSVVYGVVTFTDIENRGMYINVVCEAIVDG
jgi:CBS domain-containing protein